MAAVGGSPQGTTMTGRMITGSAATSISRGRNATIPPASANGSGSRALGTTSKQTPAEKKLVGGTQKITTKHICWTTFGSPKRLGKRGRIATGSTNALFPIGIP